MSPVILLRMLLIVYKIQVSKCVKPASKIVWK